MNLELDELNENQKKAVLTKSNKVLVMSGAGAGKTKVLTNRIAYLLSQGVNEYEIIAFTFTNKAAREMRSRLNKLLGYETKSFIGTFHSFCYMSIRELGNYLKLGFKSRPEIITEYEKGKIIKDILSSYDKDYSNIPFVAAMSKIKNGIEVKDFTSDEQFLVNAVYKEYQDRLKESSMIDFDDMIPLFLELCDIDKEYYENFCQYKYVLVDECQDTNSVQYELINKVAGENKNIFMVGDEDQLIYSFRSSDIAILKDFELHANEIIILNENYRCNKEIIKAANKLISYNQNRLDKDLVSNIEANKKIIYNDFENQIEEAKYVSNKIKQFQLLGEDLSSIAVLYRNNNQAYAIEKALTEEHIPYQIFGGMAFFEYIEIRTIIYVYRLLFNPRNLIAFEAVYNKPINQFEWFEIKKVIENYHKQSDDIITFISKSSNPKLKDLGERYLKLKELMNKFEPIDFFMQVLKHLNYSKYLNESHKQKPEYSRIMMLRDMLEGLSKDEVYDFFNNLML